MAVWVDLRPIFEVCALETDYEGGGRLQVLWWSQAAAEKHLKFTAESILLESRVWRQRESRRRGGSKEWSEGGNMEIEG